MRKACVMLGAVALLLGLRSTPAMAVPAVIPFQGRLTDAGGTVINGNQSIRFSIWSAATAGSELWAEVQPAVSVANGLFNVDLGSVTPIPVGIFSGSDLFLEIKMTSEAAAMTPRQRMGSVAYAFRAGLSPGVASVSTSSGPSIPIGAASPANFTSLTATFPAAGTAVVTAETWVNATGGGGTNNQICTAINDVSATMPSGLTDWSCFILIPALPAGGYQETFFTTRVFTVAAGAKSFFLCGYSNGGGGNVIKAKIVVEYFPDTVGPISAPPPGPEATPTSAGANRGQSRP